MPLRTAVYIRVSSDDPDKQINSFPRQESDVEQYFERHFEQNLLFSEKLIHDPEKDVFKERASAKKLGRIQFAKMLEAVRKGKYDVILCTDLTRLSRNPIDAGQLVYLLDEGYLKQVRTIDKVFTNSPTDRFTLGLFLTISKYENDQRGVNTASGMRRRRKDGATTYKAPLGYINAGNKKGEKCVEKDPDNFDKARRLWDMLLAEVYTLNDIYAESERIGLMTYRGKGVYKSAGASTVREMFSSPYYMGKIRDADENEQVFWKKGDHPPMVSEEEFERAQYILQRMGYKHVKIDKAPDVENIIKTIAVSGIYTIKNEDGEDERARIVYECKTRYTCSHCGNRYYSNKVKPCDKCSTRVDKKTKIMVHKRFSHLLRDGKKKTQLNLRWF